MFSVTENCDKFKKIFIFEKITKPLVVEEKSPQTSQFSEDVESVSKIPIVPQLLDVVCSTTGMGFAAIARVTEERWITCSVKDDISFGLQPGDELDVETTLCHEVRQFDEAIVIDHVEKDLKYCNHHTPARYGFQSYISVPIYKKDGSFFGTLCAIDPNPAKVSSPEISTMFRLFADLISFHLNSIEEMKLAAEKIEDQRRISELREQFIAILGHDLRNPIASTRMSSEILLKTAKDEMSKKYAGMIKSSTYRMDRLIENMLDFARGRLGEGIILNRRLYNGELQKSLEEIIREMNINSPDRKLEINFNIEDDVRCDKDRIGQLFSNLLGNADSHGTKGNAIIVEAHTRENKFTLTVRNAGDRIPESAMKHLFQPFYREDVKPGKQGLGLGLFIASEIARAHEGIIKVDSSEKETSFTFEMPLN